MISVTDYGEFIKLSGVLIRKSMITTIRKSNNGYEFEVQVHLTGSLIQNFVCVNEHEKDALFKRLIEILCKEEE